MIPNKVVYCGGWNTPDTLMYHWLEPLEKALDVDIVSLPYPGYNGIKGGIEDWNVENVLQQWADQVDENTLIIGWSLGGMLAALLADRINCLGLVTLASNIKFQGDKSWQMPTAVFNSFKKRFTRNPQKTSRMFWELQAQGESDVEQALAHLSNHYESFNYELTCLTESLEQLGKIDLSGLQFECPSLHLFAEQDALVPIEAARQWQKLYPDTAVAIIPGSHLMLEQSGVIKMIGEWVINIPEKE